MTESPTPLSKIAEDYAAACREHEWAVQNTEAKRDAFSKAEAIEASAFERRRVARAALLEAAENDTPTDTNTEN